MHISLCNKSLAEVFKVRVGRQCDVLFQLVWKLFNLLWDIIREIRNLRIIRIRIWNSSTSQPEIDVNIIDPFFGRHILKYFFCWFWVFCCMLTSTRGGRSGTTLLFSSYSPTFSTLLLNSSYLFCIYNSKKVKNTLVYHK